MASYLAHVNWQKVGLFVVSLYLFILAIALMKEGASALAPLVTERFAIDSPMNALGFGWLFAYVVMSGSPVAAASLAFYDAGALDQLSAFAMITGSRLGAGFIVLFLGFIYVVRGRDRATSLGMGVVTFLVTGATYTVALALGLLLLRTDLVGWMQLGSGTLLASIIDTIVSPLADVIAAALPSWALFVAGIAIIIGSFSLFDRCLPEMTVKESRVGQMSTLVYRRWVMFALGALITLVSMSVSLSLSILVPLSSRGIIRRENVIPYILGANITTFVDTLLAAVLLDNPGAFTIVWIQMLSVAAVSALVLATVYGRFERLTLGATEKITGSDRGLCLFVAVILAIPIILLLI